MKKYLVLSVLFGACALQAMEEKQVFLLHGWCDEDDAVQAEKMRARHRAQSPIMRGDNVDNDSSSSSGRSLQTAQSEDGDALKALTARLDQMETRLNDQERTIGILGVSLKSALELLVAQNNDGPLGDEVRADLRARAIKEGISGGNNDDDEWESDSE